MNMDKALRVVVHELPDVAPEEQRVVARVFLRQCLTAGVEVDVVYKETYDA